MSPPPSSLTDHSHIIVIIGSSSLIGVVGNGEEMGKIDFLGLVDCQPFFASLLDCSDFILIYRFLSSILVPC